MKTQTVLLLTIGLASVIAGPITEDTISSDKKPPYPPLSNSESAKLDESSNKEAIQKDVEVTETATKSAPDPVADTTTATTGDEKVNIIIEGDIPIEDIPTAAEPQSVSIADIPTNLESQSVSLADFSTVLDSQDGPLVDLSTIVEPQRVSLEDITVPESQAVPLADIPTAVESQIMSMADIPTDAEPQTLQLADLSSTVDEPQRVPLADISSVFEPQNESEDILEVPEPQNVFQHIRPQGNFGVQFSLTNYLYRNALASQIGGDLAATPKGFVPIPIFKRKHHKQHTKRRFTIRRKFNRYPPHRKFHFGHPYYVFYRPSSLRFY